MSKDDRVTRSSRSAQRRRTIGTSVSSKQSRISVSTLTGVVASYDNTTPGLLNIDLDDPDEHVEIFPGLIEQYSCCPQGPTQIGPASNALPAAIQRLAPPGTRVIIERRGVEMDTPLSKGSRTEMIYIVDGNGAVNPMTLNEQLVQIGAATTNPAFTFGHMRGGYPLGDELDVTIAEWTADPPYDVPASA